MSVVVASLQPRAMMDRYLSAIVPQCVSAGAELVVVRGGAMPPAAIARKSASNVKFVPAPPTATVAEMRALGARAAAGDVVLFVDEEAAAADQTLAGRLRALASGTRTPPGAAVPADGARAEAIRAYLRGERPSGAAAGIPASDAVLPASASAPLSV